MYKFLPFALLISLSLQNVFAVGAFTSEQYKKALWMVTRFYGGQRSGHGPNWLLMDHTYKTSFIRDSDGSHDLVGGWFDCGDHVLFGHTFFYSTYMLAKAYEAFPTGFHDLYHGDYSDYANSADWSIAGGQPNRIPDLLEELKYATDWIIKATPNANTFYYEKGNGEKDHRNWVTAGYMSTLTNEEGGESDRPRDIYKNPNDGRMASFAAATLAVMSKIYRKYDADYADLCLLHARNAYDYAKPRKGQSVGAASGGFYGAPKHPEVSFAMAAAEMFIATGENTYKNDIAFKEDEKNHYHYLDYANSHDLAFYAAAMAVPADKSTHLDYLRDTYVQKYTSDVNGENVMNGGGGWGALRYPANGAFSAALYSGAVNVTTYDQFIYNQIDYILGANTARQSFVVGFCEGCNKEPRLPHHRNVFLRDDNPDDNGKASMTIPVRNKYFGQLMGGTRESGSYTESVTDYSTTEGGIDYNAGLLGALAYIVSKVAPADTSKFSIVPIKPTPNKINIQSSVIRFTGAYTFPAQNKSFTIKIFNLKGDVVSVIKSDGQAVKFVPQNMGVYFASPLDKP